MRAKTFSFRFSPGYAISIEGFGALKLRHFRLTTSKQLRVFFRRVRAP